MKFLCLVLFLCSHSLFAQIERVYDENGMLRAINPLNKKGVFDGMGLKFYPDGAKQMEIPYKKGKIDGVQKEYYPEGQLKSTATFDKGIQVGQYKVFFPSGEIKMNQKWVGGKRTGEMEVFYQGGQLRIFALLKNDSILFAQNFEENGKMSSEKLGYISQKLNEEDITEPLIFFENGDFLRSGLASRAQIIVPRVPSTFLRFESSNSTIEKTGDEGFPLLIKPNKDQKEVEIFILIKLSPFSEASITKKLLLKVK